MNAPDVVHAVDVSAMRKVYGKPGKSAVVALENVSFHVPMGACFGLLGPNGAGKSTTLEIIQGVRKPTSGSVRLFGLDFGTHARSIRSRVGGVLQENNMYEKIRVREAMELFASFYAEPLPVGDILRSLDLAPQSERFLKDLSGGQRQRVFLGTALIGNPDLIFLDEPTTGLDPATRQDFWRIISGLKRQGKTVVLTTHYMEEAETLCDALVIIDQGRIIEQGSPEEIVERVMRGKEIPVRPRKATLNDVFLTLTGRSLETST